MISMELLYKKGLIIIKYLILIRVKTLQGKTCYRNYRIKIHKKVGLWKIMIYKVEIDLYIGTLP